MKKDYHYYHKNVVICLYIALALILLVAIPPLFHFIIISKEVTSYTQLGLGLTSFTFYFLARVYGNKRDDIRREERRQIKKKEFNEILTLIKEDKDDEAYDALCNYNNKYD